MLPLPTKAWHAGGWSSALLECIYVGPSVSSFPSFPQGTQEEGRVWTRACYGTRRFMAVGLMDLVGVRSANRTEASPYHQLFS